MSSSPKQPMPDSVRELLWAAAESNDAATIAEFERRYPQYRAELHRTRAMVAALRQARPQATTMAPFRLPERGTGVSRARFALAFAAVIGLALVGFSAYQVTSWIQAKKQAAAPTDEAVQPALLTQPTDTDKNTAEPNPTPQVVDPSQRGVAERPLPPAPKPNLVRLTGDATLFDAIRALEAAGYQVHVDPDVKNVDLNLAPNQPDAILEIQPSDAILLIERQAPVRIQDLGADGLWVLPLEKVRNVDEPTGRAQPSEASGN